jgi:hypothetical protein
MKAGVLVAVVGTVATVVGLVVGLSGSNSSSSTPVATNGTTYGLNSQSVPTPTIPTFQAYQPRLSLDPSSGPAGTSVTAKGTGFAPNSLVQVYFQGGLVGQKTSNKDGYVMISFVVPSMFSNFPDTQFTVSAADSRADNADQLFKVT